MFIWLPRLVAVLLAAIVPISLISTGAASAPHFMITDAGAIPHGYGVFLDSKGHLAGTSGAPSAVWFYNNHRHLVTGAPRHSAENVAFGMNDRDVILVRAAFDHQTTHRLYAAAIRPTGATWTELPIPRAYRSSVPGGISRRSNRIAGTLTPWGSNLGRPALWRGTGTRYSEPVILPLHMGETIGDAEGVDTVGPSAYVVGSAGSPNTYLPVIWVRSGGKTWRTQLRMPKSYTRGDAKAVAANGNGLVYVVGDLIISSESAPAAVEWTLHCTATACSGAKNVRILASFGGVEAVNARGSAVGWTRPGGDPGPNMQWNVGGHNWSVPLLPYSIDNSGDLAGGADVAILKWHAVLARPTGSAG